MTKAQREFFMKIRHPFKFIMNLFLTLMWNSMLIIATLFYACVINFAVWMDGDESFWQGMINGWKRIWAEGGWKTLDS